MDIKQLIAFELMNEEKKLAKIYSQRGTDEEWIELHAAVFYGLYRIVEKCIANGENINLQNAMGNTALHIACFMRRTLIIELLLRNGADETIKNNKGYLPEDRLATVANNNDGDKK